MSWFPPQPSSSGSRPRIQSNNSADFSMDSSLRGLNFLSQQLNFSSPPLQQQQSKQASSSSQPRSQSAHPRLPVSDLGRKNEVQQQQQPAMPSHLHSVHPLYNGSSTKITTNSPTVTTSAMSTEKVFLSSSAANNLSIHALNGSSTSDTGCTLNGGAPRIQRHQSQGAPIPVSHLATSSVPPFPNDRALLVTPPRPKVTDPFTHLNGMQSQQTQKPQSQSHPFLNPMTTNSSATTAPASPFMMNREQELNWIISGSKPDSAPNQEVPNSDSNKVNKSMDHRDDHHHIRSNSSPPPATTSSRDLLMLDVDPDDEKELSPMNRRPSFEESCISSLSADDSHYSSTVTSTTSTIKNYDNKLPPFHRSKTSRDIGVHFDHLLYEGVEKVEDGFDEHVVTDEEEVLNNGFMFSSHPKSRNRVQANRVPLLPPPPPPSSFIDQRRSKSNRRSYNRHSQHALHQWQNHASPTTTSFRKLQLPSSPATMSLPSKSKSLFLKKIPVHAPIGERIAAHSNKKKWSQDGNSSKCSPLVPQPILQKSRSTPSTVSTFDASFASTISHSSSTHVIGIPHRPYQQQQHRSMPTQQAPKLYDHHRRSASASPSSNTNNLVSKFEVFSYEGVPDTAIVLNGRLLDKTRIRHGHTDSLSTFTSAAMDLNAPLPTQGGRGEEQDEKIAMTGDDSILGRRMRRVVSSGSSMSGVARTDDNHIDRGIMAPSPSRSLKSSKSFLSKSSRQVTSGSTGRRRTKTPPMDDSTGGLLTAGANVSDASDYDMDGNAGSSGVESESPQWNRKKKNVIKEELKFMVGKMVPSPFKTNGKVDYSKKVELERSTGCLT